MKITLLFEWGLFIVLLFKPTDLQRSSFKDEWVAWNVGQGQWVTHIQTDTCRHYDVGGEIYFARDLKVQIQHLCFSRKNEIFVSHWDLDHYSMLGILVRWVPQVCWADFPKWILQKKSVSSVKALDLQHCQSNLKPAFWRPTFYRNTNESSAVYLDQKNLIPGDSPMIKEKTWLYHFSNLKNVRTLILGHHGSRTSTRVQLLQKLKGLKFAIASARHAKYKHPHMQTLRRLRKYQVPVLKTEDWGHIHWFGN